MIIKIKTMKNKTKNKIATTIFTFLILFASIGLWWSSTTLVDRYKAQEKSKQQQKTTVEINIDSCLPDERHPQTVICTSVYIDKCFEQICNFDVPNQYKAKAYYEIRILNQKGY